MGETVKFEVNDGVGIVRIDRPPLNAIDDSVSEGLLASVRESAERDDVRAVVVTGSDKVFAAGADVKMMADAGPAEAAGHVDRLNEALEALAALPKVAIAAMSGFALGGGLELALCADFRYASSSARLGQPEIQLGIIPGAGGTQRLPLLVGMSRAREMIYTGRRVKADEALAIGLVDKVLPSEGLLAAAIEDAARFGRGPTLALAAAKRALNEGAGVALTRGLQLEREVFLRLFDTADQKTGMRSLLENGPGKAVFEGR